jgi:hypothetical protein
MTANKRYREALAAVDESTPALRALDKSTGRKRSRVGKSVDAFNPLVRGERQLFEALSAGRERVRGFCNRAVLSELSRQRLYLGFQDDVVRRGPQIARSATLPPALWVDRCQGLANGILVPGGKVGKRLRARGPGVAVSDWPDLADQASARARPRGVASAAKRGIAP